MNFPSIRDAQSGNAVTVVIPTRNRPHMVLAAVESALSQLWPPSEVIVVIDGPESPGQTLSTIDALSTVTDPRLRVLALAEPVGGGEARNHGVRAGTGDWIAFLDDDDLWLPGKLQSQLSFARTLDPCTRPVLSCCVLARTPEWEEVWPREPYTPGQPMADYLFCRRDWRYGAALLQTSTLLAPRSLLLQVPFTPGLRKHQDWDWLLRVAAEPCVAIHQVGSQPLVVFHVEGERSSVGRARNWRFSLNWARERRPLFSKRAFSAFLATECAAQAGSDPLRQRAALLWIAAREGIGREWLRFFAFLLVSQTSRRRLRNLLRRNGWRGIREQTPARAL